MAEESKPAAEVKVRLVLDDGSKKIKDELKEDFEEGEKQAEKSSKTMGAKMGDGFKAGAVLIGNIYTELFHKAQEYAKDVFAMPIEAWAESEAQVRELASTFTLLDSGKTSFEDLLEIGGDLKDELEDLGMAAGVTDDDLVATFNNIIERGAKSVEEAQKLTEAMAYAGRAIPGGARGLSESFEAIQMGVIKAKNPIVGMISATGLLHGNAKMVAKEMTKMSPEHQMKLAEQAIERMGKKMEKVPLTMAEAVTSMKVLGGNVLESMGQPMFDGLNRVVQHVRSLFFDGGGGQTKFTEDLMNAAQWVGDMLANTFDLGMQFVDGFMEGIHFADDEFKTIWSEVFGESDVTWKSMLDFAKEAGELLGGFVKMFAAGVGAMIIAIEKVLKYTLSVVGDLLSAAGQASGSAALSEAGRASKHTAYAQEQNDVYFAAGKTGGGDIKELQAKYRAVAGEFESDQNKINADIEEMGRARRLADARVSNAEVASQQRNAEVYWAAYQEAAKAHDEAAQTHIASFIKDNKDMADAIKHLGPEILGDGVKDFVKSLKETGQKDLANDLLGATKKHLDLSKSAVNLNFNGGQKFDIKQDFRDQDPDRVAILMRKDITGHAMSRLQSRVATPFGY